MVYDLNLNLDNVIAVSPSNPIALSDIKLYQLYRVVADPNVIDDTGRGKILKMMESVNFRDPKWDDVLPAGYDPYDWNNGFRNRLVKLPDDWSWKNTVTDKKSEDGKYGTGKFAKRVRAYILKNQGISMPDQWVQDLGQIAGRYSDQSTGTVLRFVDEFDWNAGDFGDPHSCFWGGREEARVMLKDHGAWAIQFFTPESIEAKQPKGYARMWTVRNFPQKGLWTMFNGYGYNMGDPSMVISRLMLSLIGATKFREIKLRNYDSDSGTLYINSGNGFVFGEPTEPLKEKYDFSWPERIMGHCCHCEESVYEDDGHEVLDDRYYCEDCWSEYVCYDEISQEHFDTDYEDGEYIKRRDSRGRWESLFVSQSTAERYGESCRNCGDVYVTEDMVYVEVSGNCYCPDCAIDHVAMCDHCSTDHEADEIEYFELEDESLCPVCAQERRDEIEAEEEQAREQERIDAELELQADE